MNAAGEIVSFSLQSELSRKKASSFLSSSNAFTGTCFGRSATMRKPSSSQGLPLWVEITRAWYRERFRIEPAQRSSGELLAETSIALVCRVQSPAGNRESHRVVGRSFLLRSRRPRSRAPRSQSTADRWRPRCPGALVNRGHAGDRRDAYRNGQDRNDACHTRQFQMSTSTSRCTDGRAS